MQCNLSCLHPWLCCCCPQIDAEDLVFSLEALVEKFGADIAPYAVQMVGQLAAAFDRYTAAENAAADADDADDEDMCEWACEVARQRQGLRYEGTLCGQGRAVHCIIQYGCCPYPTTLPCLPAAAIAAYGCLRAINTLLESVSALGPVRISPPRGCACSK